MQTYHEILDVRYWTPPTTIDKPKIRHKPDTEILKLVAFMGLSFVFWGLAMRQGKYSVVINLIGWAFAFWSFYLVKTSPIFLKK